MLRWAGDTFGDDFALTSSMADGLLAHLASTAVPGIHVVFLDTGYHFAETLGTRDWITCALPITLVNVSPEQTVAEQDARVRSAPARARPRPVLLDAQGAAAGRRRSPATSPGARASAATSRPSAPARSIVDWDAKRRA